MVIRLAQDQARQDSGIGWVDDLQAPPLTEELLVVYCLIEERESLFLKTVATDRIAMLWWVAPLLCTYRHH